MSAIAARAHARSSRVQEFFPRRGRDDDIRSLNLAGSLDSTNESSLECRGDSLLMKRPLVREVSLLGAGCCEDIGETPVSECSSCELATIATVSSMTRVREKKNSKARGIQDGGNNLVQVLIFRSQLALGLQGPKELKTRSS